MCEVVKYIRVRRLTYAFATSDVRGSEIFGAEPIDLHMQLLHLMCEVVKYSRVRRFTYAVATSDVRGGVL